MFLFSKYFLFIAIGILITVVPAVIKLNKKKKYGSITFFIMMVIFLLLIAVYYVTRKLYMDYF